MFTTNKQPDHDFLLIFICVHWHFYKNSDFLSCAVTHKTGKRTVLKGEYIISHIRRVECNRRLETSTRRRSTIYLQTTATFEY